jgi:hypothetical protein
MVIAAVCRWLAFHFRQRLLIPENEMDGQLTDGVVAAVIGPLGLLGCEALNDNIRWNKPPLSSWVVRSCSSSILSVGVSLGCWAKTCKENASMAKTTPRFIVHLKHRIIAHRE